MNNIWMNKKIHIGSWAAAFDEEDTIWLSSYDFNGLFKYDLKNEEMTFVHRFNNLPFSSDELHMDIFISGSKLYFLPLRDKSIRVYDKDKKHEYQIALPFVNEDYCTSIADGYYAWIFDNKNNFYRFSFNDESFCTDDKICEILNSEMKTWNNDQIRMNISEKYVLLLNSDKKILLEVNKTNLMVRKFDLSFITEKLLNIRIINNTHWILLFDSHDVYSFEDSLDTLIKYQCDNGNFVEGKKILPYCDLVKIGSEIVLLNYYADEIRAISTAEKKIINLSPSGGKVCGLLPYGAFYSKAISNHNGTYLIPQRGESLLRFDGETIKEYSVLYDYENDYDFIFRVINEKIHDHGFIVESEFGLNNYIDFLNYAGN